MKNSEIAEIFFKIADILELKKVMWKPLAYRKVARTLESLKKPIKEIYKKNSLKGLEAISGIGKNLAKKIEEYILTGKIKEFEKLKKEIPSGLDDVMNIPCMGPKKTIKLYKKLKINNVKSLVIAAKKGRISNLEGFGKKSEQNILKAVQLNEKNKRYPLKKILYVAEKIRNELNDFMFVQKIEIAGSIRRKKSTVKDIDLIVLSNQPEKVINAFVKLNKVKTVLEKGKTKSSVVLTNRINIDLRIFDEKSFASGLLYFTGNKDHNIRLRKIAIKKGFKLNEYGLFKDKKRVAGKSEEEIYKKLGLKYIKPEKRID